MLSYSEIISFILLLAFTFVFIKSNEIKRLLSYAIFIGFVALFSNILLGLSLSLGYYFLYYVLGVVLFGLICYLVWQVRNKRSNKIVRSKLNVCMALLLVCLTLSEISALVLYKTVSENRTSKKQVVSEIDRKYWGMQNADTAKQDLMLFMSMYNEDTYQEAKTKINCGGEIQSKYFNSSKFNLYLGYSSKPNVVINNFGVEFPSNNVTALVYKYYAVVTLSYPDTKGNPKFDSYFITMSYSDDKLIDLVRRKL